MESCSMNALGYQIHFAQDNDIKSVTPSVTFGKHLSVFSVEQSSLAALLGE